MMKVAFKLAISIVLVSIWVWLTIAALPQTAQASPAEPVTHGPSPVQAITYTTSLPYIAHRASSSTSLIYGLNADPSNNSSNIAHIHSLGFGWVGLDMSWQDMEASPGSLDWAEWDEPIRAYYQAGIKVLITISNAPNWARPDDDDKEVAGLPANPQTYADFVISVTNRYTAAIGAVEVWDEQNIFYSIGGMGRVDVEKYMALLQTTYTALKAAHPDIIVVSGGLLPTGVPQPFAVDDRVYLQQMYNLGLKDYSDAIGVQPWGYANPPQALYTGGDYDPTRGYDDHRSFFFRNTMEDYRQIMLNFNDSDKQVWATDFGWPIWRYTGDERYVYAQENTLEEQAEYTYRAYKIARAWGWVGAMFLWNLDYAVTAPATSLANFSIVDLDGPTPAYEALKNMPK